MPTIAQILYYKKLYEPYSDRGREIFLKMKYQKLTDVKTHQEMQDLSTVIILLETWEYWRNE